MPQQPQPLTTTGADWQRHLSRPAQRALINAGYQTLQQCATASAAELLALHGMGPKGIRILQQLLAAEGLSLRSDA